MQAVFWHNAHTRTLCQNPACMSYPQTVFHYHMHLISRSVGRPWSLDG